MLGPSFSLGGSSKAQAARIRRLADQPPLKQYLPYGRWSLAKLRDYVLQQSMVKHIGREHLRRLLKRGICFNRVQRKLISHDPQRRAGLAQIRRIWRH